MYRIQCFFYYYHYRCYYSVPTYPYVNRCTRSHYIIYLLLYYACIIIIGDVNARFIYDDGKPASCVRVYTNNNNNNKKTVPCPDRRVYYVYNRGNRVVLVLYAHKQHTHIYVYNILYTYQLYIVNSFLSIFFFAFFHPSDEIVITFLYRRASITVQLGRIYVLRAAHNDGLYIYIASYSLLPVIIITFTIVYAPVILWTVNAIYFNRRYTHYFRNLFFNALGVYGRLLFIFFLFRVCTVHTRGNTRALRAGVIFYDDANTISSRSHLHTHTHTRTHTYIHTYISYT